MTSSPMNAPRSAGAYAMTATTNIAGRTAHAIRVAGACGPGGARAAASAVGIAAIPYRLAGADVVGAAAGGEGRVVGTTAAAMARVAGAVAGCVLNMPPSAWVVEGIVVDCVVLGRVDASN